MGFSARVSLATHLCGSICENSAMIACACYKHWFKCKCRLTSACAWHDDTIVMPGMATHP